MAVVATHEDRVAACVEAADDADVVPHVNEIKCISGRHTAVHNADYVAGEVVGLGSAKQVMEGHDRQRITGMPDTWMKDRPRRLLRFVLIYFLIGADGTQP